MLLGCLTLVRPPRRTDRVGIHPLTTDNWQLTTALNHLFHFSPSGDRYHFSA